MSHFRLMRDDGYFRWVFVDSQGESIAESVQSFPKKSDCEAAVERLKSEASGAQVEDHTETVPEGP